MSAKFAQPNQRPERAGAKGRILWLILAVGMATAFTHQAQACDLTLIEAPGTATIDYNPFAIAASAAPLDVKIENRADDACDLRLSFTDDSGVEATGLTLGGVGVQIRPRESSGVMASDVEPGVFRFTLAGKATGELQFDLPIVLDAVPEAGEHGADLHLLVQDADRTELLPAIPVRVLLASTPRAQLNLAGAAGAFGAESSVEVVDFGDAVTGATRQIFVQIRANTPSTLTIKSEHQGVMRRVTDDDIVTDTSVPYSVELDGAAVDLSQLWSREVDPPRTLAGVSLPMIFTLGVAGQQMAGRYQDLLTLDVSPN